MLRLGDLNLQRADAFYFAFDFIAGLEKDRRYASKTDAGRSSRAYDVAGFECHAARQALNGGCDIKNHIARIAILHDLAIDPANEAQLLRIRERAFVNDPRADGAKGIQRFSLEPLAMNALQVARRHVKADGVAEHVIKGFVLRNIAALPSHDDGQFNLPVKSIRGFMMDDFSQLADHRCSRLGKKDRVFRVFDLERSRSGPFVDVLAVIYSQHDDIFFRPGDRRVKFYLAEFQQSAASRQFFLLLGVFSRLRYFSALRAT